MYLTIQNLSNALHLCICHQMSFNYSELQLFFLSIWSSLSFTHDPEKIGICYLFWNTRSSPLSIIFHILNLHDCKVLEANNSEVHRLW
jgi:hypothetical protein